MSKAVIATVSDKELKKAKDLNAKETAIKFLQSSLVDSATELVHESVNFWNELSESYGLDKDKKYGLDNKTGEIFEK